MILNFKGELFASEGLDAGLRELAGEYGFTPVFNAEGGDWAVTASHGAERFLKVTADGKEISIEYDRKIHFFRVPGIGGHGLKARVHGNAQVAVAVLGIQFNQIFPVFAHFYADGIKDGRYGFPIHMLLLFTPCWHWYRTE